MKNIDSIGHVTGRSVFTDDIPEIGGTLYAAVLASPVASGRIRMLDTQEASALPGVVKIFTAGDIPGENQVGGILPDETLLAEDEVHYIGQPVAFVVADSGFTARNAVKLIRVDYEERQPVTDAREAKEKGLLLFPPRTFALGNTTSAWGQCRYIFEGSAGSGSQEHLYLETQGSYAWPGENNTLIVHSSTQSPALVQKTIARVLGIPMNRIEVDVRRLGGGFGGKEDQATAWAAMSALAAFILQKPVKLVLSRHDDMFMTGKRHPYSSDFRIGLTEDLKILAYEVTFYQNGGAAADLSPAILERTLFHATNSYFIPHVKATAYSCKTNLPPNTAFRGFGAPQAMFVIESAIAMAAHELGIGANEIQQKNLMKDGDIFPYGQTPDQSHAADCWDETCNSFEIDKKLNEIEAFNSSSQFIKKGMALMPVCFGISFTNTSMNQARAMVHIYQDGSIGISTGAIEMGQGVNTKLKQVAAGIFSVSPSRIRLETTNTSRIANSSPTAASSGADLNGKALQIACNELLDRLKEQAAEMCNAGKGTICFRDEKVFAGETETETGWEELIISAYKKRVCLSQTGHYATPVIHFDKTTEKGHPFAYYVFGTAAVTVTLDCLRGRYRTDSVQIVHDFGADMNSDINRGQLEGAVVQGIGWMTMEEIRYNEKGKLLSDSLSTYKIPDIYSVPKIIECKALQAEGPEMAVLGSKAIGEPPFMYGIGAYFALQNAIRAFNPRYEADYHSPMTPEKALMGLYSR
ncbi:MAG TPA: molybdopterin-dependent oxidoreductase [Bacteroidales bacterium]|nr:molybdopterin-dependent oxidoreductase [Bacteroidales bacterium]HPT01741.1 molybdopterin-dependent oxidoreductase [Bacteroidales bacterium]